jgi:hypothetical protein
LDPNLLVAVASFVVIFPLYVVKTCNEAKKLTPKYI